MKIYTSDKKKETTKFLLGKFHNFILSAGDKPIKTAYCQKTYDDFLDALNSSYYVMRNDHRDQSMYNPYWWEDVESMFKWFTGLSEEDRVRVVKGAIWMVDDGWWDNPQRCGIDSDSHGRRLFHMLMKKYHLYHYGAFLYEDITFYVSAYADAFGLAPMEDK